MKTTNRRELRQTASHYSSEIDFKNFINFCKDYTKEPYSFLVKNMTLS